MSEGASVAASGGGKIPFPKDAKVAVAFPPGQCCEFGELSYYNTPRREAVQIGIAWPFGKPDYFGIALARISQHGSGRAGL